jgi:uncharacterized protein with von Willebrand factor type A (vWA) domain
MRRHSGLDGGEIGQLQQAMRAIARHVAAIGWVNPDAARSGWNASTSWNAWDGARG